MKWAKVFFTCVMIFDLAGCTTTSRLSNVHVEPYEVGGFGNQLVTFNDDGVYFVDEQGEMFYREDGGNTVSVGYINFIDGKKANIYQQELSASQEIYSLANVSLEYYDGRIYTMYEHSNTSGGNTYELCSVNEKGEDLRSHITLEYMPASFFMTDGKVYVCTNDMEGYKGYITVYDETFQEEEKTEYDLSATYPNDFYVLNGEVKMPYTDGDIEYDDGNVQISRRSELIEGTEDSYALTGVYDKGDVHVELEKRVIAFVNEKYFYAYYVNMDDETTEQVYERYDLDGTLDTSIRIADHLVSLETITGMDFGGMINLRGEDQTFGLSQQGLFMCDFSNGKCEYLYEDAP